MSQKAVIIGILILFCLALAVGLVYLLFWHLNEHKSRAQADLSIREPEMLDIERLLRLVSNTNLSKDELVCIADLFTGQLIIPSNSKDVKAYLNFITLICGHKNTDAKLIARFTSECKRKNPSYKAEIDEAENAGIAAFGRGV